MSGNAEQRSNDYYRWEHGADEIGDPSLRDSNSAHLSGPPEVRIRLVAIGGAEGEKLHALQSEAVYETLLWLATYGSGSSTKGTDA